MRAHGNHIEHWLNGKKVLQYELDSPDLRAAIAKSKFKDIARFGKPQKGHILIQITATRSGTARSRSERRSAALGSRHCVSYSSRSKRRARYYW